MSSAGLMNRDVTLQISEPWELSAPAGGRGRTAVVKGVDSDDPPGRLLLELREPVVHGEVSYRLLVAVLRQHRSLAEILVGDQSAEADLYGIPEGRSVEDPFNLDWWRGGLGIVGTLSILP